MAGRRLAAATAAAHLTMSTPAVPTVTGLLRPDGRPPAYVPLDAERVAAFGAAIGARLPALGPNGPPRGDFGPQRRAALQDKAGETRQTANGGGE